MESQNWKCRYNFIEFLLLKVKILSSKILILNSIPLLTLAHEIFCTADLWNGYAIYLTFFFKFAKCPPKIISFWASLSHLTHIWPLLVLHPLSSLAGWVSGLFNSSDVSCLFLGLWPSFHCVPPLASVTTQQLRMLSPP